MRFSTIFVTLALSVGLAIAGPIGDRDDGDLSVRPTDDERPRFHDGDLDEGDDFPGPGRRGVTMREDFNPLAGRGDHDGRKFAILIVCHREHCRGPCWGYNLDRIHFHKCYHVRKYRSVYIWSHDGHDGHHGDDGHHHHRDDGHHGDGGHHDEEFGVYVAKHRCRRHALIPKTNRCFNVEPFADEFFKWKKDGHHDDGGHH